MQTRKNDPYANKSAFFDAQVQEDLAARLPSQSALDEILAAHDEWRSAYIPVKGNKKTDKEGLKKKLLISIADSILKLWEKSMDYEHMTAPCGLPCSECIFYLANKHEKTRYLIAENLGIPSEQAVWKGCREENTNCTHHQMRSIACFCAEEKKPLFMSSIERFSLRPSIFFY